MPEVVFTSWWLYALTFAVILVAQMVYVVFGFGSGLIAVGTLALVFPEIRDVVVILLLVVLPAELGVAIASWRRIRWRETGGLLAGVIPGSWVGSRLSHRAPVRALRLALGGLIAIACMGMVWDLIR